MHPTAELKALKDQIAVLTNRIAALEPVNHGTQPVEAQDPELPIGTFRDPTCGILRRTSDGGVYSDLTNESVEEFQARQKAAWGAARAAEKEKADAYQAGVPAGFYKDFGGMIRRSHDGKLASVVEREEGQREAVERQQGRDHRAYKIAVGLPVRPTNTDDDEGAGEAA